MFKQTKKFDTNSNFIISISLDIGGENLWYFKHNSNVYELKVYNWNQIAKIQMKRLEKMFKQSFIYFIKIRKNKLLKIQFFQAHKFPYTSSVYYQCNVKLCIKHAGGCDQVVSF